MVAWAAARSCERAGALALVHLYTSQLTHDGSLCSHTMLQPPGPLRVGVSIARGHLTWRVESGSTPRRERYGPRAGKARLTFECELVPAHSLLRSVREWTVDCAGVRLWRQPSRSTRVWTGVFGVAIRVCVHATYFLFKNYSLWSTIFPHFFHSRRTKSEFLWAQQHCFGDRVLDHPRTKRARRAHRASSQIRQRELVGDAMQDSDGCSTEEKVERTRPMDISDVPTRGSEVAAAIEAAAQDDDAVEDDSSAMLDPVEYGMDASLVETDASVTLSSFAQTDMAAEGPAALAARQICPCCQRTVTVWDPTPCCMRPVCPACFAAMYLAVEYARTSPMACPYPHNGQ